MCTYCMIGDWQFHRDPPWLPNDYPVWPTSVPVSIIPAPYAPWDLQKLREFEDLLRRVKELEDRLGCPCEPNKADYLGLLRQRIEELEKRAGKP